MILTISNKAMTLPRKCGGVLGFNVDKKVKGYKRNRKLEPPLLRLSGDQIWQQALRSSHGFGCRMNLCNETGYLILRP